VTDIFHSRSKNHEMFPFNVCNYVDMEIRILIRLVWVLRKINWDYMPWRNRVESCWLDSSGSREWPVAGFCEYSNEHLGSINAGNFLTSWVITSFSRRTLLHRVGSLFS